jgi:hypothetical protein
LNLDGRVPRNRSERRRTDGDEAGEDRKVRGKTCEHLSDALIYGFFRVNMRAPRRLRRP